MAQGSKVYDPDYHPEMAYRLSLLFGASNQKLADFFEVGLQTIAAWMREHEEFREAVMKGRIIADSQVVESLYRTALGYDYEEDVVHIYHGQPVVTRVRKHRPANPWAAAKILSLRHRDTWSATVTPASQNIFNFNKIDILGSLSVEQLKLLKEISMKQLKNANESKGLDEANEIVDN